MRPRYTKPKASSPSPKNRTIGNARAEIENVPAPQLAIDYYGLKPDAKLFDMVYRVQQDEKKHSDVNLRLSNR